MPGSAQGQPGACVMSAVPDGHRQGPDRLPPPRPTFSGARPNQPFDPATDNPGSCHSFSEAVAAIADDAPMWRTRLDEERLSGEDVPTRDITADETAAPRDIHLLTIDALLADLIGGRAVALGGREELALASDDARPVLDWYRRNRGGWQSNLSADDTEYAPFRTEASDLRAHDNANLNFPFQWYKQADPESLRDMYSDSAIADLIPTYGSSSPPA
jgi:hypothetical protein